MGLGKQPCAQLSYSGLVSAGCCQWVVLLHSCLQPLLPLQSIGGCGGYHKDLRITIKDFLGKCQVHPWHKLTTAIWAALHMIIMTS